LKRQKKLSEFKELYSLNNKPGKWYGNPESLKPREVRHEWG